MINNDYNGKYLIIDDINEILPKQKDYFIHCDSEIGFDNNKLNEYYLKI